PYDNLKRIARRLNGTKHFIYGNHDKEINRHESDLIRSGTFASIQNYYELKHQGQFIVLFHYGQRVWNKGHHGSIHLYGHSHGSLPPFGESVDVGADGPFIIPRKEKKDYRPVSMDEVLEYMKNRNTEYVDHHNGDR